MDEFRLNRLGLGVSAQNLRALGDDGGPSASASTSEVREANEQDEFILGVADLDIVGVIGTGSGGVVRLAKHKRTDEALAVKNIAISLARDDDGRKRIITELRTLHKSSCEYIVRSLGAFFDQGSVNLVMEYMEAGTMSDATKYLGPWGEDDLAAATAMLADGLHYLHTKLSVVHRDIKPCNVLLNLRGEAKLSDFGVSGHLVDASKCHSWVGTVTYMSPERIQGESYAFTADVWSFALTVMECALGRFPYNSPDVARRYSFWDLLDVVVKEPVPCLRPELDVSQEFDNFVALGLNKDPSGRMLTRNMIAHPWIFGRDRREDKRKIAARSRAALEARTSANAARESSN
jgi:mitogen-activated protein kinase kinase 1